MVLLVITVRILSAIEAIPSSRRKDLDLPDSPGLNSPISHEQLIGLSRYLKDNPVNNHGDNKIPKTLNSLLHGTRVYVPPPPKKPEPSPEYLAQKARLLAAVEADAYNSLMAPTRSPSTTTQGPSLAFSSSSPMLSALHNQNNKTTFTTDPNTDDADPLTPSLVLNIFLSILLTGFSVYWALTKFSTPDLLISTVATIWRHGHGSQKQKDVRGVSEPVRVLLSLGVAVVIGVAEVVIYAIYLKKIEYARRKERRLRERKEVVGSEQLGGCRDGADEKTDTDEKMLKVDGQNQEEIWGRGANGGVRRRVRERWEEKEKNENRRGYSKSER